MDPTAVAALMEQVRRADGLRERADAQNHEPRADSLAATDAAIPHARFVRLIADVAVGVAADHLLTWKLVVMGGVIPIYAPMTLLRSAVESAVKARWVVDDRITGLRRVGRGVAAQVEDYDERRKFEASVKSPPRPPGQGKSGADRLADLVADRDRDGVPIEHVPSYTDLTRDYGAPGRRDTQWLYRLMSAFAHGHPWALHGTNLGLGVAGAPGLFTGPVTSSDHILIGATRMATDHVDAALSDLERYLGIEKD